MVPNHGLTATKQITMSASQLIAFVEEYMSTHSSPMPQAAPQISPLLDSRQGPDAGLEEGGGKGGHSRRMPEIPTLLRVTDLPSHLLVFEALMREDGFECDSMRVKVALSKSMQNHTRLQEMVLNLINLPFNTIRDNLIGCFASPTMVRDELDKRIRDLKFDRNTISNDIRALYQYYIKVNTISAIPESTFVVQVFECIPPSYKVELIKLLHSRFPNQIWQTLPVFSICEALDEVCFLRSQIEVSLPSKKPAKIDTARRVQQPTTTPGGARAQWLADWMARYSVYYINQFSREEILKILAQATEHVQLRKKEGGHYYVVCFESQKVAEQALSGLSAGSYRPASSSRKN
jgi:hypothetical protein